MKKTVLLLVACILLFGCSEKQKDNRDSLRFKEEYESLNADREYRAIEIDPDNPFVYATAEDIVRKMEDGESFIVYFGANWCPWCRSVIPVFIDTCKSLDIKTVYYVDVRPGNDLTKDIRDEYGKDAEGNIIQVQKGTEGYHRFIELAGNVLDDNVVARLKLLLRLYILVDALVQQFHSGLISLLRVRHRGLIVQILAVALNLVNLLAVRLLTDGRQREQQRHEEGE